MVFLTFRGRAPAQLFEALFWRIKVFGRRFFLIILREFGRRREKAWIESRLPLQYVISIQEVRVILQGQPGTRSQIFAEADRVLSGWTEVSGFGSWEINLNPPEGCTPAEAYAYRLLARLDFLRPLLRASLLADEASTYIGAIENFFVQWVQVRGQHRRWNSVDEAIRVLILIETLALMWGKLKPETISAGLQCILDCAWEVQTARTRTGNHLIYEGLALVYAGTCLGDYFQARTWRELGRRILETAMRHQVTDDGLNSERCTNYHLITGTNFLKAWVLGKKTGQEFSASYQQQLMKMAMVAHRLRGADSGFFALGDSDRMQGSSREEREAEAFAELGRILCDDTCISEPGLELQWLLAGVQFDSSEKTRESLVKAAISCGGYHILTREQGSRLVFDAGPFGLPGASHHGHADSLSFEVHLPKVRFLVDPGGFSYVDGTARAFARSTAAHNTVVIDDKDSTPIIGPFGFGKGAQARLVDLGRFDWGFILTTEHDGYARLASPVIHRRALAWLTDRPFALVVLDRLEGKNFHKIEAFFHADREWGVQRVNHNQLWWNKAQYRVGQTLWATKEAELSFHEGQTEPCWQGWIAPAFGEYVAAPTLVERYEAELPLDIVNVFCETGDAGIPVEFKNSGYTIRIGGDFELTWKWSQDRLSAKLN